jgi:hypothetical protein
MSSNKFPRPPAAVRPKPQPHAAPHGRPPAPTQVYRLNPSPACLQKKPASPAPPLPTRPPQPKAPHTHAPAQPCRSCHAPNAQDHRPSGSAPGPNAPARFPARPQPPAPAPRAHAPAQPKAALPHPDPKAAAPRPTTVMPAFLQRPAPKVLQRLTVPPPRPEQKVLQPTRNPAAPPAAAPPSGTIQLAKNNYASDTRKLAKGAGARIRSRKTQWLGIDKVKRTRLGWFGERVRTRMGVPVKPKPGSICQKCKRKGQSFHLDHMNPWRHYVGVMASKKYSRKVNGEWRVRSDVAKTLFNDPANLWWICDKCNLQKSDIIPVTSAHAKGDFTSGMKGRNAPDASTLIN